MDETIRQKADRESAEGSSLTHLYHWESLAWLTGAKDITYLLMGYEMKHTAFPRSILAKKKLPLNLIKL